MKHRYSRYPVYDADKEEIVGIVHVKDLFSTLYKFGEIKELLSLMRPVLKVSRHLFALDLLHKFREGMPHFALVYSKQGTLIGFITIDNLFQVLIGRIKDEFHRTQIDWKKNADGSLSVKGDCSIYSLEQAIDRDIDIGDDNLETLTGLIFQRLGSVPKEHERIAFAEFDAVIEHMQGSRIVTVKIWPKTA